MEFFSIVSIISLNSIIADICSKHECNIGQKPAGPFAV